MKRVSRVKKGQAITNIILGVILFFSSIIMFFDKAIGAYAFIPLLTGMTFWIIGAVSLLELKSQINNEKKMKMAIVNLICFIISCILMAMCILLPIVSY